MISVEDPSGMGMVGKALSVDNTNDQVVDGGYDMCKGFAGHAGLILLKGDIAAIV